MELAPVQSHEHVLSAAALNIQPVAIPEMAGLVSGISVPTQQTMSDYLLDNLRYKHMLLILDNFELVLPAATLVDQMLETASNLSVLVTSRAVLHLDWEWVYDLHGLTIPLRTKSHFDGY